MNPPTVATEQPEFYDDPLLYDVLYSSGTDQEVDLLERIDREYSDVSTPAARRVWLEPACGSGRYLRELSRRGRRCIGFDIHEGMLAYARAQVAPRARRRCQLHRADLRDFTDAVGENAADFALIPVNTIRHLMSGVAMARHFREMARALRPGGLYVVGISLSCYGEEDIVEDSWEGRRGPLRVHQSISYIPPEPGLRREQVISHLRVQRPRGTHYRDSTYWLRSYDEDQWRDFVSRSSFERVASLDDDGNPVGDRYLDYQLEVLRLPHR
jgi:SAM-dependent methyltransferase